MLIRLALETRPHHATAAEERLVLLEHASLARYRAFLIAIHGFEAVVEQALACAPRDDASFVRSRGNAALLAADLRALGVPAAELVALRRCATVPTFRTPSQALGWLYVLERNTLLHGLVRRHLATVLPEAMEHASSYLAVTAATPGARHHELGVVLDQFARVAAEIPQQLVAAANEAFRCQRHWYLQRRELGACDAGALRSVATAGQFCGAGQPDQSLREPHASPRIWAARSGPSRLASAASD
jgi:heme oxygenase